MKTVIKFLMCAGIMMSMMLSASAEDLTIYSDYYYMIDMDNGQVILDKGSTDIIYPASMTKIMTLIVALENIDDLQERVVLDTDVFSGLYEANASMAGFYLNETVTLEDCLYGLFLPSGAETTRAAAFSVAGSEEAFVELMNKKAEELGMKDTHYINTTGLHDSDHVTTLRDLSILLDYCLQNETFNEIFSTRKYVAKSGSMHKGGLTWESTTFKNLDRSGWRELAETDIVGGKTGYTIPAGLCLASVGEHEGRRYMLITAHAPSGSTPYHVMDAAEIYSEVFYHYNKEILINKEELLGTAEVRFNLLDREIEFYAENDIELTIPDTIDTQSLEIHLAVMESYDAPIKKGDMLGTATLVYEGEAIYSFELLAQEDIERNPLLYGAYCLKEWMLDNLILTGFIVFVIGFGVWRLFIHRYEITRSFNSKRRRTRHYRM